MGEPETLPDYLGPGLAIVSIGLNPSLSSVREGYYFANPRNRFWRALKGSGLVSGPLVPGVTAQAYLFAECGIGFTDVVKRPTAGGGELRAADYREGAPLLRRKLVHHRPVIAWFHGKQACANYLRYTGNRQIVIDWGEQPFRIGVSHVYMTPNPSPANAAYSLDELIDWYRALREFRVRLGGSG